MPSCWQTRGMPLPQLVTSSASGTLQGDARPGATHAKSEFVAQGLTLGLELDW